MRKHLIRMLLVFIFVYSSTTTLVAQGKFAGPMKEFIGRSYTNEKQIPWLKGYSYVEGSVIPPVTSGNQFNAYVFKQGSTLVVVFTNREDANTSSFAVLDVLEIKNVQLSWKLRTVNCDNGNEGANNIVALVQTQKGKNDIVLKAWRCNMDKNQFDEMSPKLVHCSGE